MVSPDIGEVAAFLVDHATKVCAPGSASDVKLRQAAALLSSEHAARLAAEGALKEIAASPHAGFALANPTLEQAVNCADTYWSELKRCQDIARRATEGEGR